MSRQICWERSSQLSYNNLYLVNLHLFSPQRSEKDFWRSEVKRTSFATVELRMRLKGPAAAAASCPDVTERVREIKACVVSP